jgi:hypothetical protein
MKILIYTHLGLGDHIVCNGLVRQLYNETDEISLACQSHNLISVSSMFSDLRINYVNYLNCNLSNYDKVYKPGFSDLILNSKTTTEEQFYSLAGLDISYKYSKSKFPYVDRDEQVYDMFIHDDDSRNLRIPFYGPTVYRPRNQYSNILDYIPIIKRAKEIHVIKSSFMHLVECLNEDFSGKKLVIHDVRPILNLAEQPYLTKPWIYV